METIIRKPTYTNDRYMKIDYNGGLRDSSFVIMVQWFHGRRGGKAAPLTGVGVGKLEESCFIAAIV